MDDFTLYTLKDIITKKSLYLYTKDGVLVDYVSTDIIVLADIVDIDDKTVTVSINDNNFMKEIINIINSYKKARYISKVNNNNEYIRIRIPDSVISTYNIGDRLKLESLYLGSIVYADCRIIFIVTNNLYKYTSECAGLGIISKVDRGICTLINRSKVTHQIKIVKNNFRHICFVIKSVLRQYKLESPYYQLNEYRNVEQGTDTWLKMRTHFKLTSSEFGSAIGVGRFKSRGMLWKIKSGRHEVIYDKYAKRIMQWGTDHEVDGVKHCKEFLGFGIEETGIWPYLKDLRYASSPDGLVINKEGEIIASVEVKCPWTKVLYKGLLCDRVEIHPDHYIQVQSQLACIDINLGYYVCWTPSNVMILEVPRNKIAWTYIVDKMDEFLTYIENDTVPPRVSDKVHRTKRLLDEQYRDGCSIKVLLNKTLHITDTSLTSIPSKIITLLK